jgi:hypothetical protein
MKKSLRILTVLSVVASSVLITTPSQAASSDRWVAAYGPSSIYVKDISNLIVGTTVSFKSFGTPNNLFNPFPTGVTILSISISPTTFNLCSVGLFTCTGSYPFADGDTVYEVQLNQSVFGYYTLAEFTFDAALTSPPGVPTSGVATATGKRSATVSFAAPASDGGSAITSYTATSTPGGIIKTLTQATGGTFTFDALQPGTAYTFAITATNAIGTSTAATSNSVTTTPLVVASLSALSFTDDGTGTGGRIVWAGQNIDAVLFTGSAAFYPGPYNYGAFTSGWNGRIRNLTPDTSYTVSIYAISADGVGESKSLTFKTSATLPTEPGAASATISQAAQTTTQMPDLFAWIKENVFVNGEGDRMKALLNKFEAVKVPTRSAYLRLPVSSVAKVSATSSTPAVCTVEGLLTVRSIAAGTCTISYTVTGASNAPATLVKDFVFKRHAK